MKTISLEQAKKLSKLGVGGKSQTRWNETFGYGGEDKSHLFYPEYATRDAGYPAYDLKELFDVAKEITRAPWYAVLNAFNKWNVTGGLIKSDDLLTALYEWVCELASQRKETE